MKKFTVTLTIYDDQLNVDMATATCRVLRQEITVMPEDNFISAISAIVYTTPEISLKDVHIS